MRIFGGKLVGGIVVLCLCSLLIVFLIRTGTRAPEQIPYASPLVRIATGPGLLDIETTQAVASDTDYEPIVQRLYAGGWPRTAARLARLQTQKKCRLFMRVAMEIGDGELFWANRTPDVSPDEYWNRQVHPWYGGERRYNLLKRWPASDASPQRLMQWPAYFLSRPVSQTVSDYFTTVSGILPRPFAAGSTLIEPFVTMIPLSSLFLAVILPEAGTSENVIWDNIGNLTGCGFSWRSVRPLAGRLPDTWLPRLLQLAMPENDDELMIQIVKKSDVPANSDILDLMVSLPPEVFARAAGGARRPVLLRHHAIPEITALIGSEAALFLDRAKSRAEKVMEGMYGVGFDGILPAFGGGRNPAAGIVGGGK